MQLVLGRPPVPPVGVPVTPRNQAADEGSGQTGTKMTVSPPSLETAEPLRPPPAVSSLALVTLSIGRSAPHGGPAHTG